MIFIVNNLKYDTDKMELVSERCEYYYSSNMFGYRIRYTTDEVKVWKSRKDNWLLTYKFSCKYYAKALTEIEVKELSILLLILKLVGSICMCERLRSITQCILVRSLIQQP